MSKYNYRQKLTDDTVRDIKNDLMQKYRSNTNIVALLAERYNTSRNTIRNIKNNNGRFSLIS